MPFAQRKFLISKEFNLSIVSFINHALSFVSKIPSPNPKSPRFPPILSSKTFAVVHLYLWSIFSWFMWKIQCLWLCSFFFFFACKCQASCIEKSMLLDRLTDTKNKVVDTWGEREEGGNRLSLTYGIKI